MKIKINKQKGLSLIEALIWFAIFSSVLMGVFTLYSSSRTSSMISDTNKEIASIFAKGNSLYASEGGTSFGFNEKIYGLDITSIMVQMGVVPSTLKWDGTILSSRFGGPVNYLNRTEGFVVLYKKIPTGKICVGIVSGQRKIGWDFVVVGSSSRLQYDETYSISKAAAACSGDNGIATNTITLQFASCVGC